MVRPSSFVAAAVCWIWGYAALRNHLRRFTWLERLGELPVLVFLLNAIARDELLPPAVSWPRQFEYGFFPLLLSFAVAAFLHVLLFDRQQKRPAAAGGVYELAPDSGAVTLAR